MDGKREITSLTEAKERRKILERKAIIENEINSRRPPWRTQIDIHLDGQAHGEDKEDKEVCTHNHSQTPATKYWKTPKCWNCLQLGHKKNFCSYKQCHYCFKFGHIKKNCQLFLLTKLVNQKKKEGKPERAHAVEDLKTRVESIRTIPDGKRLTVYYNRIRLGEYIGSDLKEAHTLRSTFNTRQIKLIK